MAIFGRHSNAFGMIPIERRKDKRGRMYSYIFPLPQSYYLNNQKLSQFSDKNPTITFWVDGDENDKIVIPDKNIGYYAVEGTLLLPSGKKGEYVYILFDRDQKQLCISKAITYFLRYNFNKFMITYNKKVNVNIDLQATPVEMVLYDLIPIPEGDFEYIPVDSDSIQNCEDSIDPNINYETYLMNRVNDITVDNNDHNDDEIEINRIVRIINVPRAKAEELFEFVLGISNEIQNMTLEEKKEYFNPIKIEQKLNLYKARINAFVINGETEVVKFKKLVSEYIELKIRIQVKNYLAELDIVRTVRNVYRVEKDLNQNINILKAILLDCKQRKYITLNQYLQTIKDVSRLCYIQEDEKAAVEFKEECEHGLNTLISEYVNDNWEKQTNFGEMPKKFIQDCQKLYKRSFITSYVMDIQKFASKPIDEDYFHYYLSSNVSFKSMLRHMISCARARRYSDQLSNDEKLVLRIQYNQLLASFFILSKEESSNFKRQYVDRLHELKLGDNSAIASDIILSDIEKVVINNRMNPEYMRIMKPYFLKLHEFYFVNSSPRNLLIRFKKIIKTISNIQTKYEESIQTITKLAIDIPEYENHIKSNFKEIEENKKFLKEIKIENLSLEEVNEMLEKCKDIQLFVKNQNELKEFIQKLKLEILNLPILVNEINDMLLIVYPIDSEAVLQFTDKSKGVNKNGFPRDIEKPIEIDNLDTNILDQFETPYWQELLKN